MERECEGNDIVEDLLLCLRSHLPLRPDLWEAPTDTRIEAFFQREDVHEEAQKFVRALLRLWGESDLSANSAAEAPGAPAEMTSAEDAEAPEKSGSIPDAATSIQMDQQPGSTTASRVPKYQPVPAPIGPANPSSPLDAEPLNTTPGPSGVPDLLSPDGVSPTAAGQSGGPPAPRPEAILVGRAPDQPPPVKVSFTLEKNAKVGEAFSSWIHAAGSTDVAIADIIVPQGIGVGYDAASRVLRGTPTVAGDHVLKIHYRFAPAAPERPVLMSECLLTVNADPRSLWQNQPSKRDAPGWKPDEDKKYLRGTGERRLAAASKRGCSHAHMGGFREDDFFLDVSSGWNVLAVADGAGSATMSRRASEIAVQNAGEFLKVALGDELGRNLEETFAQSASRPPFDSGPVRKAAYPILGRAAVKAVQTIEEEANTSGLPVKDYSTTLILGVHKRTRHGHLLASYWVGDGGVAAYRTGLGVEVLGEADSGEFAGQTRFLDRSMVSSYDEILKRIRVTLLPGLTALVLMTDGVSDPKFETDRNMEDLSRWDAFWGEVEPLLADDAPDDRLLAWLDFWSQGNHDDRTIAVLW